MCINKFIYVYVYIFIFYILINIIFLIISMKMLVYKLIKKILWLVEKDCISKKKIKNIISKYYIKYFKNREILI